jgi:hypothetical protein
MTGDARNLAVGTQPGLEEEAMTEIGCPLIVAILVGSVGGSFGRLDKASDRRISISGALHSPPDCARAGSAAQIAPAARTAMSTGVRIGLLHKHIERHVIMIAPVLDGKNKVPFARHVEAQSLKPIGSVLRSCQNTR